MAEGKSSFDKIKNSKYTTPVLIGGGVIAVGAALYFFLGSQNKQEQEKQSGKKQQTDEPGKDTGPSNIIISPPNQSVPLYSLFKRFRSANLPFIWNSAPTLKWDTVVANTEYIFKQSHTRSAYIANLAGEIIVNQDPIKNYNSSDMLGQGKSLAGWVNAGGVYVDYTLYPMYYPDGALYIGTMLDGNLERWNRFCDELGIKELGYILTGGILRPKIIASNFWSKINYSQFTYNRSLTILGTSMPSRTVFKTSDMIPALNHVPYIPNAVYSMFALKGKYGFYAYSNLNNDPNDYATFLNAVHSGQI